MAEKGVLTLLRAIDPKIGKRGEAWHHGTFGETSGFCPPIIRDNFFSLISKKHGKNHFSRV
jgi:hypothetical protein